MPEHPNADVMRRAVAAFQAGDAAAMTALFADDLVWRIPGKSPVSRTAKNRDEFFQLAGQLMELSGGTFKVENLEIHANDAGGVFVDRLTAARDGRKLDLGLLLLVRIRGGKIVEGTDYFHDQYAWDAFWS